MIITHHKILEIDKNNIFWLPYSITPYSNYRRDYVTYTDLNPTDNSKPESTNEGGKSLRETKDSGGQTNSTNKKNSTDDYKVNEKIKFLKPKQGDTIISGRVGNTIRFSEFFLTEDGKTSSSGIFIRNKQNPELDSKKIGELVEEDINKDGTSIYITSNKIKVPFKEEVKKEKKGFKDYPNSKDLSGDQLFINSDRIILSATLTLKKIYSPYLDQKIIDFKSYKEFFSIINFLSLKNLLIFFLNLCK